MPYTKGTVLIPADARVERIPEPAFPLVGFQRDLWLAMWATPIATLWTSVDVAPLSRLVILQTAKDALLDKNLLAEMRHLEDRFLLNPYSRVQQRVVIGDDESQMESADASVAWFDDAKRRLRGTS